MLKISNFKLRKELNETNEALAILNRELAAKMIALAAKTGETQPLIEAVQNLARTNNLYTVQNTAPAHAEIQKALGDTLFKLARKENDIQALEHAIIAYRGAITLASLLGETRLRNAARKNCHLAEGLLSGEGISTYSAA